MNVESEDIDYLLAIARVYEKKYQFSEAVEVYNRIILLDEFNLESYDRLIIIHRKMKEFQKELDIISRAIRSLYFIDMTEQGLSPSMSDINDLLEEMKSNAGINYDDYRLRECVRRLKFSEYFYRYARAKYLRLVAKR